jgi:dihydropteroate synthase
MIDLQQPFSQVTKPALSSSFARQSQISTVVMGILNITPDSYYDGGWYVTLENAMQRAAQMIQEGATIIDVGGESTRPGSQALSPSQECDRVIPVIEQLKKTFQVPLSIDSRHPEVMAAALKAGAEIVNDINALQDVSALTLVAEQQVRVCLMHMQGSPQTMQNQPHYENVLQEVYDFFAYRIELCQKAGILQENIWIDPGFGFGKKLVHNLTLLGNLSYFKTLGVPIVVGLSRKSMFGEILSLPVEQRLYGSLAGAVIAAMQGAAIIRTHDVAATKEALAVVKAVQSHIGENKDLF